jgi:N-acetylglucosaminyl-diphospho-decaprenol L-rhamnosyltransferase
MNYKDITVGIVTFESEKVIFDCLKSIKRIKRIIIFDNANDIFLKKKINLAYPKIKFILSKKNLGYGNANNEIIKLCKTKYLFILNPDTVLKKNCETELLKSINIKKLDFSILAPISQDTNFGSFKKTKFFKSKNLIETNYTKGFAMLVNKKKIKKIGMFDKNIFLYLEEIDLCKRLKSKNQKIYLNKKAKIFHKAAKSSNIGFEFEKCRNWHWMWSSVYYKRKYSNHMSTLLEFFPSLFLNLLKIIFYFLIFQFKKSFLNYMRLSGTFNALIGNKSWYRPNYK